MYEYMKQNVYVFVNGFLFESSVSYYGFILWVNIDICKLWVALILLVFARVLCEKHELLSLHEGNYNS